VAQVQVLGAQKYAVHAQLDPHQLAARQIGINEVENALSAGFNLENRAAVLVRSVEVNERSLGYARVRYEVGSGDQRGVQQQLLALHAARTTLVHVQAERLIQRVNLHLALGGGFEPAP